MYIFVFYVFTYNILFDENMLSNENKPTDILKTPAGYLIFSRWGIKAIRNSKKVWVVFVYIKGVKFLTKSIMYIDWKAKKNMWMEMNGDICAQILSLLLTLLIFQVVSHWM